MRKFTLLLPLALLLGCPVVDGPPKDEKKADTEKKTDEKAEPEKPDPAVWVFGLKAETAMYKKGKDGASDTIQFGGVGDRVSSPDGKREAEVLKIVESNLFPEETVVRPPQLADAKTPEGGVAHAWLVWLDDKQAEVAISNPLYSAGAGTLTLDVEVIDGQVHEGSLGKVELRVQDCPDQDYQCAKFTLEACNATTGKVGTCWSWPALNCLPCHCSEDMAICKKKDPKCCGDADAPCYPSRLGPHGWERYCL
jgi:hypothetical protein